MNVKKILFRFALSIGTIGVVAGGAAAFSAFEAHVINVTATIENALSVPIEQTGLSFGTTFPQEAFDQAFDVSLSQSFQDERRVDDVEYTIRQKPKCAGDNDPSIHPQVTEVPIPGTDDSDFKCPTGSHIMPLLCPYLSKHEVTTDDPAGGDNDGPGINSFHGLPNQWTLKTTLATAVNGKLQKLTGDISDLWNIDLHVPCFQGQCAQDWASFVQRENPDADPNAYMVDPANEHNVFGCDLWLETTKISTTTSAN